MFKEFCEIFVIIVWKILKIIFSVFFVIVILVLMVKTDISIEERRIKEKCYEIYATDNVILKKCQKYFEEEK